MNTNRALVYILGTTIFLICCMPWLANAEESSPDVRNPCDFPQALAGIFVFVSAFLGLLWWDAKRYAADAGRRWIIDKAKEGITNMRSIDFEASNKVYTAPAGSKNVDDLHVNLGTRDDGSPSMLSVWAFDEDEMASLKDGSGFVMLEVMGDHHPVVALRVVKRDGVDRG